MAHAHNLSDTQTLAMTLCVSRLGNDHHILRKGGDSHFDAKDGSGDIQSTKNETFRRIQYKTPEMRTQVRRCGAAREGYRCRKLMAVTCWRFRVCNTRPRRRHGARTRRRQPVVLRRRAQGQSARGEDPVVPHPAQTTATFSATTSCVDDAANKILLKFPNPLSHKPKKHPVSTDHVDGDMEREPADI